MTDNNFENMAEQASAFQRMWMDSTTKMMQAAFTVTPNSPAPEVLRHMRSGIFQALSQSWEEFMRSPQFLEGTKQWMDNLVSFRKMTNDFMARARNEMQAPSRDDIDTIMLNVRHLEKRLLDRIDQLSAQVEELNQRLANGNDQAKRTPRKPAAKATAHPTETETL
ncbi:MAG TPA: hypothetical protein VNT26_06150 [Candidatus Sulfotelmatobacter sp.]|nr:hypothetical protein [Candidatus Sulfotelmatobacter sp.]